MDQLRKGGDIQPIVLGEEGVDMPGDDLDAAGLVGLDVERKDGIVKRKAQ